MNRAPWEVCVSNIVNSALYGIGVFVMGLATRNGTACLWALAMFAAIYLQSTAALLSYQVRVPGFVVHLVFAATIVTGAIAGLSLLF